LVEDESLSLDELRRIERMVEAREDSVDENEDGEEGER
jgi:hypothetical protein